MLLAPAYSWLRLLLDLADVRLRVHDPEAELLLLRHQLRVMRRQVKKPQLNTADRTIMAALSQRVNRLQAPGSSEGPMWVCLPGRWRDGSTRSHHDCLLIRRIPFEVVQWVDRSPDASVVELAGARARDAWCVHLDDGSREVLDRVPAVAEDVG